MRSWTLFAILLFAAHVEAQSTLNMLGKTYVSLKGNRVSVKIDAIENVTGDGLDSGDLQISVWALKKKFKGASVIKGYAFFTCNLDPITDGYSTIGVRCKGRMRRNVPRGKYYILVGLAELQDDGFLLIDYIHLTKKWSFIPK